MLSRGNWPKFKMKLRLRIKIIHSVEWSYKGKFRVLQKDLLAKFPGRLQIIATVSAPSSNDFEVLIEDGTVAWSKKATGHFPSTRKHMDQIFKAVDVSLNKLNSDSDLI